MTGGAVAGVELSVGIRANPRSQPIIEGRVNVEGVELHTSVLEPSELYWRALEFEDFHVADLSFSSLLNAYAHGNTSWVALPIFAQRQFFHTGVLVRDDAGIESPADLAGKRIGVPEYQQTGALFTRGVLQHEFGLDPRDVHWYMERLPEKSHGGATGFEPPRGIDLSYIPLTTDLGEMLSNGQVDGAVMYNAMRNLVDRSRAEFGPGSGVRHLFNRRQESARYFAKTGFFPMNGCVVIRRDVVDRYPWVALNLYSAFLAAKENASRQAQADLGALLDAGVADEHVRRAVEFDLYPYGVLANRTLLETATSYAYEQGLTSRQVQLEELFYPATLEL